MAELPLTVHSVSVRRAVASWTRIATGRRRAGGVAAEVQLVSVTMAADVQAAAAAGGVAADGAVGQLTVPVELRRHQLRTSCR